MQPSLLRRTGRTSANTTFVAPLRMPHSGSGAMCGPSPRRLSGFTPCSHPRSGTFGFRAPDWCPLIKLLSATICGHITFGGLPLKLEWGGSPEAWSDSAVIGTLVGFGLLLTVFIANELWMGDRALLQPRLLKIRRVWTTNAYIFFLSGGFFALIYYLPIYFQSVQGTDPLTSGIHSLPIIIGSLLSVLSGFVVAGTGHWVPFMAIGAVLDTIGCGLCYTLDIGTGASHWIGYQAIAGIGMGVGMQIPFMACQAVVSMVDISSVSAITLFFQIIGGSFAVSAAQAAFANTLVKRLPITAPNVEPRAVLAAGATNIRATFPPEQIQGILEAYVSGLEVVFALSTGLVGMSVLFAVMPRWEKLRPVPKDEAMEAA